MKQRKINPLKGVSLVEVIVAILIITIVSITATTLILSSSRVEERNLRGVEVSVITENAVECFRFAEDKNEFLTLLSKTGEFSLEEDNVVFQSQNYKVIISADFTLKKITVLAVDSNEKEFYSLTYGG